MVLDKILLVRHDLTRSNIGGYIQGQRDTPLQEGFRTRVDRLTDIIAQEEGLILAPEQTIHIFCSDLDRTYETGERIHRRLLDKYHLKSEFRYTSDLRERGLGYLEGKSFEEALPFLSFDSTLSPDSETIYGLLYLSNDVPNGERHEDVKARLGKFVLDYVQQLDGVGIVVSDLISGMNNLKNLLTDGNILSQPYKHFSNLSVIGLSRDRQQFLRYTETINYGLPSRN